MLTNVQWVVMSEAPVQNWGRNPCLGRIHRAEGLSRRPALGPNRPKRGEGKLGDYDLGFTRIDIKHPPKLQTTIGERRERYLHVAIDRRSRSVHLAVKDDETERNAIAFLREAAAASPFRITHVLTDDVSPFIPHFVDVCTELGAGYRLTRRRQMGSWSASAAGSPARCSA